MKNLSVNLQVILVSLFTATLTGAQSPTVRSAIDEIAKTVVEAPLVDQVEFSPDGTKIIYAIARPSTATNQITTELLIQAIDSEGNPIGAPTSVERAIQKDSQFSFQTRWCPDSSCITYKTVNSSNSGAVMRYDIAARNSVLVHLRDEMPKTLAGNLRPQITGLSSNYKWLRSGKAIAFTAPLGKTERIDGSVGVRVSQADLQEGLSFARRPKNGLFLLDTKSGSLTQVSPDDLHVGSFDFSPDERSIVVVTSQLRGDDKPLARTDLVILDRNSKAVRQLVTQPGADNNPVWSPDGKWIAFQSAFGVAGKVETHVAVVSAAGGRPVAFAGVDREEMQAGPVMAWAPDSRSFYYSTLTRMTWRLNRADVDTQVITPGPLEEGKNERSLSLSTDIRWLAFAGSSPVKPPELYIRPLPGGSAKQLTHLSSNFQLTSQVNARVINWRSSDGKFTVHGLLLTPTMKQDQRDPLPTLVFVQGGPSMVFSAYGILNGVHPEILALAVRGYAVFIPNTRGRGGYGDLFRQGIKDGASYGRLPFQDLMAGVDELVKEGLADPNRLGIFGQSYGGYLTELAVTQTNRFRAAIDYEGASSTFVVQAMKRLPGTGEDAAFVAGFGIRNPFAPEDIAKQIAESPAFNMHRAATPVLMLYGERSLGKHENTYSFYSALRRFNIPHEYIMYLDERHTIGAPVASVDLVKRMSAWFDYWVRDMPYPEPELQKQYDQWKAKYSSRYGVPKSDTASSTPKKQK